jgi:hypothetical protein
MGTNVSSYIDQVLSGSTFPAVSGSGNARLVYLLGPRTVFTSLNGGAFVIGIGTPMAWGASSPALNNFLGRYNYAQNATEINCQIPAPVTGSLFGFNVRALDANFSATATFTLRKAAVNTTLTVGVTNAVNNAVDSTHTTTVNRGDLLSVRLTVAGLTNRIWASVFLAPGG